MYTSKEFKHQLLAAIPVIFIEFIEGIGYGWTAPTLRQILDNPTDEMRLTTEQASWIGSIHEAGRFLGPLLTMSLLGQIGRKGVFTSTTILFCITFSLIACTRSVPVIYASRFAFGVGCGMNDVTVSIYLSENFKPTYRGLFASFAMASFYAGYLFELCWANFFSYDVAACTNAAISFLILSSIFVSTETAPFLIAKGKYERAWKNFLWLQGKEDIPYTEEVKDISSVEELNQFQQLKQQISEERKEKRTITAYLSNPFYRKVITLVLVFCVLTIAAGSSALSSFVSIAFAEGVLFTPNEYAIIFGALQFASSILTPMFIERANRRTILITGLIIAVIAHGLTALLYFLQEKDVTLPGFSWWIFTTITAYALTYSCCIVSIFYTTRGELMPQNIRAFGGSLVIMSHGLVCFLTAKAFLIVDEMFGMYWNFIFYALMSFVCMLFVYFVLPETRGKSLKQIQAELQSPKNDCKA